MLHLRKKDKKDRGTQINLEHLKNMHYSLILEGIIVGCVAGLISAFYRYMLGYAEEFRHIILEKAKGSISTTIIWIIAVLIIGFIISRLLKAEPFISGSGIPQVKAELLGHIKTRWYGILPAKMLGGFLGIFSGLSLGREGPSIQLGAMAGKAVSRFFHRLRTEERFLITCGASAGLSVAFNAPLAGVMFSLEEVHKSFSAVVLVSCVAASTTADFICRHIFGLAPVFNFNVPAMIPLKYYGLVILLGALCGILGALYNWILIYMQKKFKQCKKIKPEFRVYVPLLVALILGFICPDIIGTGEAMIERLTSPEGMIISTIIVFFVVKLLFSLLSFSAGAPGGIFFPLLILGAYIGGAFGMICIKVFNIDSIYFINFVILAMAGYFAAIVRAPITGIILIFEMTASFNHVLTLSIVSIVAHVFAEILKSEPVYETLLKNLLEKKSIDNVHEPTEKIIVNVRVDQGSEAEGKFIKDLKLPNTCLLVAVRNEMGEHIPNGGTMLNTGDELLAIANDNEVKEVQAILDELTTYQMY